VAHEACIRNSATAYFLGYWWYLIDDVVISLSLYAAESDAGDLSRAGASVSREIVFFCTHAWQFLVVLLFIHVRGVHSVVYGLSVFCLFGRGCSCIGCSWHHVLLQHCSVRHRFSISFLNAVALGLLGCERGLPDMVIGVRLIAGWLTVAV
jgi:hypothetical protein